MVDKRQLDDVSLFTKVTSRGRTLNMAARNRSQKNERSELHARYERRPRGDKRGVDRFQCVRLTKMTTTGAKYFVSADGKKLGPFTGQQIRTKLFRKTITADDYVWRDGLGDSWVKISTILDELPSDAVPPPPEVEELRVNIRHTDGSPTIVVAVPKKGVYEPAATLKQKNLLMKLGYESPETLRHIGRDQASYIIDRLKQDYAEMFARHAAEEQRAKNKALGIALIILLGIGLAVAAFYWLLK
ncbi:MAG TPA: hypothetical protein DHU55_09710 [Blastocatellia bacterium]|nr:hypothetical protein [Blastocatellia bacterium]